MLNLTPAQLDGLIDTIFNIVDAEVPASSWWLKGALGAVHGLLKMFADKIFAGLLTKGMIAPPPAGVVPNPDQ